MWSDRGISTALSSKYAVYNNTQPNIPSSFDALDESNKQSEAANPSKDADSSNSVSHSANGLCCEDNYRGDDEHNDSKPNNDSGLFYIEHVQMTGFTLQETIISGLYVWKTNRLLEVLSKADTRSMVWPLLVINIIITGMDLSDRGVLGFEYYHTSKSGS